MVSLSTGLNTMIMCYVPSAIETYGNKCLPVAILLIYSYYPEEDSFVLNIINPNLDFRLINNCSHHELRGVPL